VGGGVDGADKGDVGLSSLRVKWTEGEGVDVSDEAWRGCLCVFKASQASHSVLCDLTAEVLLFIVCVVGGGGGFDEQIAV
jgi:hypothetical protein